MDRTNLFRLIYGSRAHPSMLSDLDRQVVQILATSQRNNGAVGVTGLLLSHDDVFVQALEGEREAVEAVYRRVAKDPRHTDVRMVSADYAAERLFGAWSMCGRTISPADAHLLQALGGAEALQPEYLDPVPTLNLLSAVSQMRALDEAA